MNQIQSKQLSIVKNAWPFLKVGGKLYYITCSAFAKENEVVIAQLDLLNAKMNYKGYYEGFNHKGDTMFMACFEKMTN